MRRDQDMHAILIWIRRVVACLCALTALEGVLLAQQTRVKPVQQVKVEDSTGKTVGRAVGSIGLSNIESSASTDLNIRTVVLLQVDQTLVLVMVGRTRFYGGRGLWYESENCMGIPYFPVDTSLSETDAPSLLPQTAIAPPGQTIYIAIPGAAGRTITGKSNLEFGLRCTNRTITSIPVIPAQPLIDMLTEFTPPFSLKAAP